MADEARIVSQVLPVKKGDGKWNKCQDIIVYSNGEREYRCYAPHNPHWYVDEAGDVSVINVASITEKKAPQTQATTDYIRSANVASVGISAVADEKSKYLGLRPDDTQVLNTESLEFSINSILFDGVEQKIDLSQNIPLNDFAHDLGSVVIMSTRQRTRQMVKVASPISTFKITFTIYLKGLTLKRDEVLDEYWIYNANNEFKFRIRKPCLIDECFSPISVTDQNGDMRLVAVKHSLTDNGNGTYTYIKESSEDLSVLGLPKDYYIDADTYYSTTADGRLFSSNANFTTLRNAASATYAYSDEPYNALNISCYYSLSTYKIVRSFFVFDTTGVTDPSAATLYLYGYTNTGSSISAQEGTQADTLVTEDFDSFTGSPNGTSFGTATLSTSDYVGISFNAAGIEAINANGNTKICCREYSKDFSNSAPAGLFYNGCYFSDNAESSYDPYLSITVAGGGSIVFAKVHGIAKASIAKIKGVAIASIAKIMGK